MPNVPVWFQARDYFGNKLATMSYADADNGAQQLMDAFNAAGYTIVGLNSAQLNESAEQLYHHFVDYGNAENVSPNNYFNVDYYIQQKIDQLATTTQTPPYPFKTWTKDALNAAMDEAGLSYWDHYAKYGTQEGINPSAQFDTNAYLDAKAAQLNALPADQKQLLPDGTEGTWTRELVAEALANADLSALEHYYDYGIAEKVDYQPLPEPQPDVYYKAVDLAGLDNPVVGTADNENFIGTVGGANATITQDTQIDGGDGQNMLTATLASNFNGFKNADALQNIETVTLTNPTAVTRNFNAANAGDIQTWNLNEQTGAVNITNLAAPGTTVNLNGLQANQTTSIGFAPNATAGSSDAMNIGLNNVGKAAVGNGTPGYARVRMLNVEDVTINSIGTGNYADLSGVLGVEKVTVTGSANLDVKQAAATIKDLDASDASGNLTLNLSDTTNFHDATLGSGADTLKIGKVQETSGFDGGEGQDKVEFASLGSNGHYRFNMHNVETMQIDDSTYPVGVLNNLLVSGANTSGLETLILNNIGSGTNIMFAEYDNYDLNVKATGPNLQGTAQIADVQNVTFTVGEANNVIEDFTGNLVVGQADTLSINVGGKLGSGDRFEGNIIAPNVTTLNINNDRYSGNFVAQNGSDLSHVSELNVTGYTAVDLSNVANLGHDAQMLAVEAGSLEADFTVAFNAPSSSLNPVLTVTGSNMGDNNITIGGQYDNLNVKTGMGDDVLNITLNNLSDASAYFVDLGQGNNTINYWGTTTSTVTDFLNAAKDNSAGTVNVNQFTMDYTPSGQATAVSGAQVTVAPNMTVLLTPSGSTNYSTENMTFMGSNNGVVSNDVVDNAVITAAGTGTNGYTANLVAAATTVTTKTTDDDSNLTINADAVTASLKVLIPELAYGSRMTIDLASPGQQDKIGINGTDSGSGFNSLVIKDYSTSDNDQIFANGSSSVAWTRWQGHEADVQTYLNKAGFEGAQVTSSGMVGGNGGPWASTGTGGVDYVNFTYNGEEYCGLAALTNGGVGMTVVALLGVNGADLIGNNFGGGVLS